MQMRPTVVTIRSYRVLVFNQTLIITTQTDQEQDTCDILEAMYPLATLALLAADVDHQHLVLAQMEDRLCDAYCAGASMHDVLLVWHVARIEQSVQIREEIDQAVTQESALVGEGSAWDVLLGGCCLVSPIPGFLDVGVRPQLSQGLEVLHGERLPVPDVLRLVDER